MDQVRVALAWLKEQHFWVLSGLALIVALVCWFLAQGALQEQFTQNKGKIGQEFDKVSRIRNQPFHPNDKVNEYSEAEIAKLAEKVEQIWTRLYDRQREQVLKWPAQLDKGVTSKNASFLEHVKGKQFGDFISTTFQQRYFDYVQNRFPDLPKIVQALELDDEAGRGRGQGGFGGASAFDDIAPVAPRSSRPGRGAEQELVEEQEYLVLWDDQIKVKQQLAFEKRPSPLKIWVTQEDLWVYETLLLAVAETNAAAGADRYSNAAVRNIVQLQVGSEAAKQLRTESRIFRPEATGAGGRGGELLFDGPSVGGNPGGGGIFDDPGIGGAGAGGEGAEEQLLLGGRYIDENGAPIAAPQPGAPIDPSMFGQEYKRLPVRLALQMDQRWLPRLIAELANAPLQVEVDEVRINPPDGLEGGGGRGIGGGGGLRAKRLRALELVGGRGGGFGGGLSGEVSAFPREPYVASVVVRGIVYIFNPPDPTLLSVGDEQAI